TSGELFVTNSKGNSETGVIAVTETSHAGLRTLSGGQYSLEVEGFVAVENGATPDLGIGTSHPVRGIYPEGGQGPSGVPIEIRLNQNGSVYCTLTIPAGTLIASAQDGTLLPPLQSGARVTMDITSVGQTNPGSDLTVIIRL